MCGVVGRAGRRGARRQRRRPGRSIAPAVGSVTARPVSVVVPVFVTRNDQLIVSPRSVVPSSLTSVTTARLDQRAGPRSATTGVVRSTTGCDVTVTPSGSVAVRGRGVVDVPGIDVGLGDRVGRRRRAGRGRARRQRGHRAGDRAGLRVGDGHAGQRSSVPVLVTRNDHWDRVAEIGLAVVVDVGDRRPDLISCRAGGLGDRGVGRRRVRRHRSRRPGSSRPRSPCWSRRRRRRRPG